MNAIKATDTKASSRPVSPEPGAEPYVAQESESSVLRYYTSQLMLRVLASDDYDPDGASFAEFGSIDAAPFLSIYDAPQAPHATLMLQRTPSVVVLPPTTSHDDVRVTRGVFTVIPAEGFAKEPGQPVFYNDPIELMDPHGRRLGIVTRAPYAGHLAADGHTSALVFVLERHTSRLHSIGQKFFRQEKRSMSQADPPVSASASSSKKSCEFTRKQSMVAVCGGERLRIQGLTRILKKQFPGSSIVQHANSNSITDSARTTDRKSLGMMEKPAYLTCEIVLTSQPVGTPPPSLSVSRRRSQSSSSSTSSSVADRTATGDFVGVLHSGVLYRRSEHFKIWKKRFFVLTQVALHRFDAHETLESIKKTQTAKSKTKPKTRGVILLKDCRGVRYERFARPHELEIELNSGKLFSLHAVDALTCANWASVLSQAIENPQWVHAERGYVTVWRSDAQFESPQCPKIASVVLTRGQNTSSLLSSVCCSSSATSSSSSSSQCRGEKTTTMTARGFTTVSATRPRWNEKLSLGSLSASGYVVVQLVDGKAFRLTLEDLTRALVRPSWIAVATSLEVAKIQSLNHPDDLRNSDLVPESLTDDMLPMRQSELSAPQLAAETDTSSRFLVRLKFRADLQLDQRLTTRRSRESEKRLVSGFLAALLVLPAIAIGYSHTPDPTARSVCVFSSVAVAVAIVAFGPVAWQVYLWLRYNRSMEGELHWFLTLLALEVRPHGDEMTNRVSCSSSASAEASRSQIDSSGIQDDHQEDESEDGAIVLPTRASFVGDETTTSPPQRQSPLLVAPQAIRTFRLEHALDSILARPQLSFFAIKRYFPTRFLPRDAHGRRVLLVKANAVDHKALRAHNVSGFNVARHFLFLYEFIWSYQDLHEGATRSELVMVVDCSGWHYFKWFGIECQILMNVLETTHKFYPGRLAKVVFIRDKTSYSLYGQLLGKCLDPSLRALFEREPEWPSYLQKEDAGDKVSKDETMLHDFVKNVLATYGNVTIPSFTRRELDQAARFARTGSLAMDTEQSSSSLDGHADRIGTRAVLLPDRVESFEWLSVLKENEDDLQVWRLQDPTEHVPIKTGTSFQSDAQVCQWRGRMTMKATCSADVVVQYLKDPKLMSRWMDSDDKMLVLDQLSRQEDISFWSRRVPFMSFSLSGHRRLDEEEEEKETKRSSSHTGRQTNPFFECVVRRIHESKKGTRPQDRVSTVMWKTTSAQPVVVNQPPPSAAATTTSDQPIQWRKLEDPFVSLCFVVEEAAASPGRKQLTLSFSFQSFAPPATTNQNVQIAKIIVSNLRALDQSILQATALTKITK